MRVVVWDLDLEAPGVHHFPVVHALSSNARAGTLDLLELLWQRPDQSGDILAEEVDAVLNQAVVTDPSVAGGRLGVLAPNAGGAIDRARLAALDLPRLFTRMEDGPALLRLAAERLMGSLGYDLVIVDARTGVSDLAATASVGLPDALVFVLRMDEQDLANIQTLISSIWRSRAEGPGDSIFHVLPVSTFVPNPGEDLDLAERLDHRRRDLVERVVSPSSSRERLTIEIPFRLASLLDEVVPSLEGIKLSAAAESAYTALADELAGMLPGTESLVIPEEQRLRGERVVGRNAGTRESAAKFIEDVAELLGLDGWRVSRARDGDGAGVDLRITKDVTFGRPEQAVVSCMIGPGRLQTHRMRAFAASVGSLREVAPRLRALVVSQRGFSVDARLHAGGFDIDTVTPLQLLDGLTPLDPLRAAATREWENTELESRYVPLMAKEVFRATDTGALADASSLDERVMNWLHGKQASGLLAILGDFGAGKSTFTRHLAFALASSADDELPVALTVDLKTAGTRALSAEGLIGHALATAGVPDGRQAAWRYRLTKSKSVVLLVDGFDEMLGYTDPPAMREVIGQLIELSQSARVILTSRTNYFISHRDAIEQFEGETDNAVRGTELWNELTRHTTTTVLEVQPFDKQQVLQYLQRVFAGRAPAIARQLETRKPLGDIVRRPYLLKLVAGTVETWEAEGWPETPNLTALYDTYVEAWQAERNTAHISLLRKGRAGQAIDLVARAAWAAEGTALTSAEIARTVESSVLPALNIEPEHGAVERVSGEIRTATFLSREGSEDRYSFVHSSFLEFFVARGIAEALRGEESATAFAQALNTRRFTPEVATFLYGWTDLHAVVRAACSAILESDYQDRISENALALAVEFGRSEHKASGRGGYVKLADGPVRLGGARLIGVDLSGTNLERADLRGARLDSANLSGAQLGEAKIDGASMERARLVRASAVHASVRGVSGAYLDASSSDLRGVQGQRADLRHGNFAGADLSGANFEGAMLIDCSLDGALVQDGKFEDADLRYARARISATKALEGARLTGSRLGFASTEDVLRHTPRFAVRHSDWVRGVATFDWEGETYLASCADDQRVIVRNAATGLHSRTLAGHTDWIRAIVSFDDGGVPRLATGGDDSRIIVWDPVAGVPIEELYTGGSWLMGLASYETPDGTRLVSVDMNGLARVWDPSTREELREFASHSDFVRTVVTVNTPAGPRIVTAGGELEEATEAEVFVWDPETGELLHSLTGHRSGRTALSVIDGPAGDLLITGGPGPTIRVWDVVTGQQLEALRHDEPVVAVAGATLDGARRIFGAGDDGSVLAWSLDDPGTAQRFEWSVFGIQQMTVTDGPEPVLVGGGASGSLATWDARTGPVLAQWPALPRWADRIDAVLGDSTALVTLSDDRLLRLWDTNTGGLRNFFFVGERGVNDLAAYRVDGTVCVATVSGAARITVWDAEVGKAPLQYEAPDADKLHGITAFADGDEAWLAGHGEAKTYVWLEGTGELVSTIDLGINDGHSPTDAGVVSGTPYLLSADEQDAGDGDTSRVRRATRFRIWNAVTGENTQFVAPTRVIAGSAAAFHWEGAWFLAAADRERRVRVWNVDGGEVVSTLAELEGAITRIAIRDTDEGPRLAICLSDQTARIWSPFSGADPVRVDGLEGWGGQISWLDDGRLAGLGSDSSAGVWGRGGEIQLSFRAYGLRNEYVALTPRLPLSLSNDSPVPAVRGTQNAIEKIVEAGPYDGVDILMALAEAGGRSPQV